ncbi:MAG: type IX secretion system sortase PorU [Bacteroidota bacterium]
MKKCLIFLTLTGIFFVSQGQRKYLNTSVLSTGQWIKIAVPQAGVYKVTGSDLRAAGLTGNLASGQIRLFGNGGEVLPESNAVQIQDDLKEVAVDLSDGGDGSFDANDFFLFYTPGPHQWKRDSLSAGFLYTKNPYSDLSYYFIQLGAANGKRLLSKKAYAGSGNLVDVFDEHLHHELDSINFLKSGKEWYGEHFSNQTGRVAMRDFNLNVPTAVSGAQFILSSEVIGTSANQQNKIAVSVNGKKLLEHLTQPIQGSLISPVASISNMSAVDVLTGSGLTISYQHTGGSLNAASWLNWFNIAFKRKLDMQGLGQLSFRLKSIPTNQIVNFVVSNAGANFLLWEVSDQHAPQKIRTSLNGSNLGFVDSVVQQHEYIVFDPAKVASPQFIGKISNQNLHQLSSTAVIIITEKTLMEQAIRLRDFHSTTDRMTGMVVDIEEIYNEFSSGTPDPSAVRNFLKMLVDRSATTGVKPAYVLLFGSASYRIKEKAVQRNSKVPSYQTDESLDPLMSYVTDDYFGFLDDNDDINNSKKIALLDLGIGRLPARNAEQARKTVDKIIRYNSNLSLGEWRNNFTLVADDEDYNLHVEDAELHASLLQRVAPQLNTNKIYLDAFKQESSTGGSRYPEVNREVLRDINNGTLVWNYSGHGNSTRLAYEVLLDKDLIAEWKNENRLPFFITATCDFAPFDDQSQFSLGEDLLLGRNTGAIGMVTTTRLVFASSNREMNNNFLSFLTARNADNTFSRLGNVLKDAKNYTYQNSTDYVNVRKFTLLGDPVMRLAMPEHFVTTNAISLEGSSKTVDTLSALNKYTVTGEIKTAAGNLLSSFNGNIYPVLYDKPKNLKTLANDADSKSMSFSSYANILYKGKVKAENGKFSFTFTLPKDIDYAFGKGKLVYYAENGSIDASGSYQEFNIGGSGSPSMSDVKGPDLKLYLDTLSFQSGDVVGSDPIMYLQLSDPSGINLSEAGIGHQIAAVLDDRYADPILLNEYFKPTGNGSGLVVYQLEGLSAGKHRLEIKAWDVYNNSSTVSVEFMVQSTNAEIIKRFIAFPNPFSERVQLSADLNISDLGQTVLLDVYGMDGKWIKHQEQTLNQKGSFNVGFEWDGKNMQGMTVQKGIYLVKLSIVSKQGKNTSKVLKLIKL